MSSSQTSISTHSTKKLDTSFALSARRGVCVLGLGAAWQQNPFPCAPFIRRVHTCCELSPSRGPSRQRPSLTQASCTKARGPTDGCGWNDGRGGACSALAKLCRSGAQTHRNRSERTPRQVGKPWPFPPSCSSGVRSAARLLLCGRWGRWPPHCAHFLICPTRARPFPAHQSHWEDFRKCVGVLGSRPAPEPSGARAK